ncbi:MAG: hypothetical protein OR994_04675 [Candidatus Poseidoniales archaeon]|nr:hypothetical protein [Candidatus Poseidoniales archaeon]
MVRNIKNKNIWSLTLVRSGGYTMNDELEDAHFAFGRTSGEIENHPKLRIPTGLVELLKKTKLEDDALETGFFVEISSKPIKKNGWFKFEQIVCVESKSECSHGSSSRAVFSVDGGIDTFELDTFPWTEVMPHQVWVRVSGLNDRTLAWILSKDGILCDDQNEQRILHDFFDLEIGNPEPLECLRLPPPTGRSYNFFDKE